MRGRCLMVFCGATLYGVVAISLGGCSGIGMIEPPPRVVSLPPSEMALQKSLKILADMVKWPGMPEASPVRQAHPLAPADWMLCVQSTARDLSPIYAAFFNGNTMVHYRIAVEVDECGRTPYAPVPAYVEPPPPLETIRARRLR
ncbi:MAG: hypothetical protein K2Y71_03775 [Xanthobacteraceae bacterium]|nr:hypothetical protein [Xanthobacteraceae bacterium]